MLNCREMTQVVTAYLEGELPIWSRMGISMHIMMCSHCRRYFKQIRDIQKATGKVPELDVPPDVAASLNDVLAMAWAEETEADRAPEVE